METLNDLEELIRLEKQVYYQAQKQADNARAVTEMPGFKDYMEWIDDKTKPGLYGVPGNLDELISFLCGSLMNAGILYGVSWFAQVQQDPGRLAQSIQQNTEELEDLQKDAEE